MCIYLCPLPVSEFRTQNAQVDHGQNVYQRTVIQQKMDRAVSAEAFKKVTEFWKPDQRFAMVWEYFPFEKVCSVPNDAMAFNGRGKHLNIICLCMADISEPDVNKSNREKIISLTELVASAQPDPDGSKYETYGNYSAYRMSFVVFKNIADEKFLRWRRTALHRC